MTKTEFQQQAHPMMCAVDDAMARIFGRKQQTREEIQAALERAEDEFIARIDNTKGGQ